MLPCIEFAGVSWFKTHPVVQDRIGTLWTNLATAGPAAEQPIGRLGVVMMNSIEQAMMDHGGVSASYRRPPHRAADFGRSRLFEN